MIPDFKTYLRESIWSDMQDRGTGKVRKKEDDVNLMDIKKLCEYLKTVYKCRGDRSITYYTFHYDGHEEGIDTLVVTLYEDRHGYMTYLYYDGIHIDTQLIVLKELKCTDEFNDRFSSKITNSDNEAENLEIFPKDKNTPMTNRFFMEVLDFFLDKIEYPLIPDIEKMNSLKESIWSDMQDRGTGELIKKEDDVDHMDKDRFFEYLKDCYEYQMSTIQNTRNNGIYIPVFNPDPASAGSLALYVHYPEHLTIPEIRIKIPSLEKAQKIEKIIRNNYDVVDVPKKTWLDEPYMIISPKDGSEVTNSFCLSVIDFLLDVAKKEKRFRNLIKK